MFFINEEDFKMTASEQILKHLKDAYPKALGHEEIRAKICPSASNRRNVLGGSQFQRLVDRGLIKRITVGYYVYAG